MFGPTTYCKSLPALILHVLRQALIHKELEDRSRRREPTSSMTTTRIETTRGLTYSVSRVTEVHVTTWQSVDVVCLCCLTHGSVTELGSLLAEMEATGSAYQKR